MKIMTIKHKINRSSYKQQKLLFMLQGNLGLLAFHTHVLSIDHCQSRIITHFYNKSLSEIGYFIEKINSTYNLFQIIALDFLTALQLYYRLSVSCDVNLVFNLVVYTALAKFFVFDKSYKKMSYTLYHLTC